MLCRLREVWKGKIAYTVKGIKVGEIGYVSPKSTIRIVLNEDLYDVYINPSH